MLSKPALETALGQLFTVIFPPHRSKEMLPPRIDRILYIHLLLKKHRTYLSFRREYSSTAISGFPCFAPFL